MFLIPAAIVLLGTSAPDRIAAQPPDSVLLVLEWTQQGVADTIRGSLAVIENSGLVTYQEWSGGFGFTARANQSNGSHVFGWYEAPFVGPMQYREVVSRIGTAANVDSALTYGPRALLPDPNPADTAGPRPISLFLIEAAGPLPDGELAAVIATHAGDSILHMDRSRHTIRSEPVVTFDPSHLRRAPQGPSDVTVRILMDPWPIRTIGYLLIRTGNEWNAGTFVGEAVNGNIRIYQGFDVHATDKWLLYFLRLPE